MTRFLLAALTLFYAFSGTAQTKKRPNIILIMSDDHARKAISTFDPNWVQTPNIDRIAKGGVKFANSYCTNSICAPSRAVIMTGKHSHLNGQIHNGVKFNGEQQTFPKLLQKAGYQTALVGKWHLQSMPTGFHYWTVLPDQGQYYNPDFIQMNGDTVLNKGYVTNLITDKAINWLDKGRDTSQPFCLLLYHKAPHRNWMPDTVDFNVNRGRKYPVPANYHDSYEGRTAAASQEMTINKHMYLAYDLKVDTLQGQKVKDWTQKVQGTERMNPAERAAWDREYAAVQEDYKKPRSEKELSEWKYQRYMEDYLRTIVSVDRNVGRVLDYLDEHQLVENTIVIYCSDQGFYLGEHGWYDKRFMYEESLVMPLLMRYPAGIKPGGEIKELVQNLDYAPTLLDYAGVSKPADMQGLSMKPILEGKKAGWRDAIYYHYFEYPGIHAVKRHYGVRTSRYKLIHFYNNIDQWELYDLQKDPQEMKNVYKDPSYRAVATKLHAQLDGLRAQYRDTAE